MQGLEVVNEAKSLALVTGTPAQSDAVCAMLAFYHLFKNFKKIRLVVPEAVPAECFSLPESSVIEKDLGPKNLSINLDTNGVPLEKVSYLMEARTFKLILHPQVRSFEVERVSYEILGHNFDLFVFFAVKKIEEIAFLFNYDLGEIYKNVSLNLNTGSGSERFASVNLVSEESFSICDFLFKLIGYWKINFTREVSLCLLTGLLNSSRQTAFETPWPTREAGPAPEVNEAGSPEARSESLSLIRS